MKVELLNNISVKGRQAYSLPKKKFNSLLSDKSLPKELRRKKELRLPEVSELDVVRQFTGLSHLNYSVDTNFYPLGSCTMKYNPKVNETISNNAGFSCLHPLWDDEKTQGILEIMHGAENALCEICGMDAFTLQPAAGAHGELTGLLIARAYHRKNKGNRTKILIPDSAHGTNPASAALAGASVVQVKSNHSGRVDISDLKSKISRDVALVMLTVPNTLGLFEGEILEISDIVHKEGALLYMDGANLNALMGLVRPGDLGFDILHVNLHKTFSTPHGGGGPGSGPVGVKKDLMKFLPVPRVVKSGEKYSLNEKEPDSIGRVKAFHGNIGVIIKAYAYISYLGGDGLKKTSENAIISANYIRSKLKGFFRLVIDEPCMHEVIFSADLFKDKGIHVSDVAKRLLDYGFYAPTIAFPLIVPEALMIEPTETESKERRNPDLRWTWE